MHWKSARDTFTRYLALSALAGTAAQWDEPNEPNQIPLTPRVTKERDYNPIYSDLHEAMARKLQEDSRTPTDVHEVTDLMRLEKEKDHNPVYKKLHERMGERLQEETKLPTIINGPSKLIKPGPIYHSMIQINGISQLAMIDDGAQVTRINKTWANKHGIFTKEISTETITMADCKTHSDNR
ncbi:hypothetical protein BDR26DRAFT_902563 [Obelidium mucronatum]|nr:hypothetical protein BDR26DRAFT_902563 [Obelidium mucronatum]